MGHRNPEAIALPARIAAEGEILHREPVFGRVLLQKGNVFCTKSQCSSEFCYKKGMAPDVVMNQICNNIIELLFSDYAIWLLTLLQKVKFNFCDEHDCPFHSKSPFKAHYDLELIDS